MLHAVSPEPAQSARATHFLQRSLSYNARGKSWNSNKPRPPPRRGELRYCQGPARRQPAALAARGRARGREFPREATQSRSIIAGPASSGAGSGRRAGGRNPIRRGGGRRRCREATDRWDAGNRPCSRAATRIAEVLNEGSRRTLGQTRPCHAGVSPRLRSVWVLPVWALDRSVASAAECPFARQWRNQLERGSTKTLAPSGARRYRSMTSWLIMRMQPDETLLPMVHGSTVPWMR